MPTRSTCQVAFELRFLFLILIAVQPLDEDDVPKRGVAELEKLEITVGAGMGAGVERDNLNSYFLVLGEPQNFVQLLGHGGRAAALPVQNSLIEQRPITWRLVPIQRSWRLIRASIRCLRTDGSIFRAMPVIIARA